MRLRAEQQARRLLYESELGVPELPLHGFPETDINPARFSLMMDISRASGFPLQRRGRVLLVVWGLLLLGGFGFANRLEPDPRGFGTHQRLGLPPCTFQVLFHISCPSCGMTTSFSHFSRGEFASAWRANPAGLMLAVLCAMLIPWSWWSAWQSRTSGVSRPAETVMWLFITLAGVALVNWIVVLVQNRSVGLS